MSILHLDRHPFHLLTITSLSGGFLIGGGSAFPTFEHGFGSNVAVNFEVVLASGEVVNVNEKSNKDLFWAIKAGSTNYGTSLVLSP